MKSVIHDRVYRQVKPFTVFLLIVALITMLSACGTDQSSPTASSTPKSNTGTNTGNTSTGGNASNDSTSNKEKIVINYWYSWGDKIGETKEALVKMFNESQDDIEVKAAYQGTYDDQHAKVQSAFVAGNAPEVWENEIASVGVFAQAGLTQDLTPFVERDKLDINDFIPGLMGNSYVDRSLNPPQVTGLKPE